MGHFAEFTAGRAPHMLGGRGRRNKLRKFFFYRFQFPRQLVILKILQLRGVLIVIQTVVFFNDDAQFFGTLTGLFQFHDIFPHIDINAIIP